LTVPAAGIDAAVTPYTAEEAAHGVDGVTGRHCLADGTIVCIDPLSPDEVSWQVGGLAGVAFGSQPGDTTTGTVYLYGHTVARGGGVFARVGALHTGDQATVVTVNGTLVYRVQRIVDTSKADFASTPEAVDQVPGRLLLISCDHGPDANLVNGGYSTRNVVVVLQRDN
jgi:LPXTG-site transpeptidase (sortase) family protein